MREDVLGEFRETEVSNLRTAFVHEHIGDFEVPVDDILLGEVTESLEDVLDDGSCLVFAEVTVFAKTGLEISLVAEFGYDVAVAIAGEDLEALEDIRVAQLLEDIDFGEKEFFKFFAFEGLEFYDLDGDDFV